MRQIFARVSVDRQNAAGGLHRVLGKRDLTASRPAVHVMAAMLRTAGHFASTL